MVQTLNNDNKTSSSGTEGFVLKLEDLEMKKESADLAVVLLLCLIRMEYVLANRGELAAYKHVFCFLPLELRKSRGILHSICRAGLRNIRGALWEVSPYCLCLGVPKTVHPPTKMLQML